MSQGRLSELTILLIENEILDWTQKQIISSNLAPQKARKINF